MSSVADKIRELLCTSFGLGYSPYYPGTVGSLPAAGIFILVALTTPPEQYRYAMALVLLVTCCLCVLLGHWAEKRWNKDPRYFVLDEYAGFFTTVLIFRVDSILATACWGFLMTRIFDIIKPFPAGQLESLPGGWGILMDDLMASVYSGVTLLVVAHYFPSLFAP
jgi:phosphatidylglycerophosphatase A